MCPDRLVPDEKPPRSKIRTEAQAINYIEELIDAMQRLRTACDVPYSGNDKTTIQMIQRVMWAFLNKQGQVVGALNVLSMVGLLSDRAYKELHQRAINALIPTISKQPTEVILP